MYYSAMYVLEIVVYNLVFPSNSVGRVLIVDDVPLRGVIEIWLGSCKQRQYQVL